MMVPHPNSTTEHGQPVLPVPRYLFRRPEWAGELVAIPPGTSLWGSHRTCTIQLPGSGVQAFHCLFFRGAKRTLVRGLQGHIWLNRQPLNEAEIQDGDLLTLGGVELRYTAAEASFLTRPTTEPAGSQLACEPAYLTLPDAQDDRQLLARMTQARDDCRQSRRAAKQMRRRERDMQQLAHDLQQRWNAQTRWLLSAEAELARAAAVPPAVQIPAAVEPEAGREAALAATTELEAQIKQLSARLGEFDQQQQQLLGERQAWLTDWQQEQARLTAWIQPIPAELAQLRQQQADMAALDLTSTAEQQAAFEILADRCAALEVALSGLHAEQHRLEVERTAWQTETHGAQERLVRQAAELNHRLELLASQPPAHETHSSAAENRDDQRNAAQRHSIEDRLAGLQAEREAFEDLRRKERAEQALSRHLGKLAPENDTATPKADRLIPVEQPTETPPEPAVVTDIQPPGMPLDAVQPEIERPVAEPLKEITPAPALPTPTAEILPEEPAPPLVEDRLVEQLPADAPPREAAPEEAAPVATAPLVDPFERLNQLLKQDAVPTANERPTDHSDSRLPVAVETPAAPAAQPAPNSPAAPVSAAELLRRMGHEIKFDDEPATEELAPRRANPADEPAIVLGVSHSRPAPASEPPAASAKPKGEGEDETIDDYMARLLNRVRTASNDNKSNNPTQSESSYRTAAPQPKAPAPPPVLVAEDADLERRKQEYVRRAAPESTSDLRKFREVANSQARAAIDTHARKRLTDVRGNKLLVTGLAAAIMCCLIILKWQGVIDSYLGIAGSAVVALLWGLQFLSIVLRSSPRGEARVDARPTATPPSDQSGKPATEDKASR